MDYPVLPCHTLEMHHILLTYNLRLNYIDMFNPRIWSPWYKYVKKGNSKGKHSFDHIVTARKSVPGGILGVMNCQSIGCFLSY